MENYIIIAHNSWANQMIFNIFKSVPYKGLSFRGSWYRLTLICGIESFNEIKLYLNNEFTVYKCYDIDPYDLRKIFEKGKQSQYENIIMIHPKFPPK